MAKRNRPNELPLTCVPVTCFTWTGLVGVSEVSSLPEHLVSRVYDDACDVGFLVRSTRTGRTLLFTHADRERDAEGELVADVFRANDGGRTLTIKVFND